MEEQKLGGNIILSRFNLDKEEMIIVKKIVGKYAEKIRHFSDYQELKLEMKTHKKGRNKKFEIRALLTFGSEKATSEETGFNPFLLIDEILKKVLQEVEHKVKKGQK